MRSKNKTKAEWMTLIQTCRSSGLTDSRPQRGHALENWNKFYKKCLNNL